jgi:hypothetical protein
MIKNWLESAHFEAICILSGFFWGRLSSYCMISDEADNEIMAILEGFPWESCASVTKDLFIANSKMYERRALDASSTEQIAYWSVLSYFFRFISQKEIQWPVHSLDCYLTCAEEICGVAGSQKFQAEMDAMQTILSIASVASGVTIIKDIVDSFRFARSLGT